MAIECALLLPLTAAVPMRQGTIQSARASFTVVPTASATAPYLAAAPTTELVSWIASAAHNPNWVCESFNHRPIVGNVSKATEFSTKMVPSETDISSSVAPVIGPTAAMALPPQIAVPVEMRNAGRLSTRNHLPSSVPRAIAKAMLTAV